MVFDLKRSGEPTAIEGPVHTGNPSRQWGILSLQFSPDGSRFAYLVAENNPPVYHVVIDGVSGPAYDQILHDSLRVSNEAVSFIARRGDRIYLVTQPHSKG